MPRKPMIKPARKVVSKNPVSKRQIAKINKLAYSELKKLGKTEPNKFIRAVDKMPPSKELNRIIDYVRKYHRKNGNLETRLKLILVPHYAEPEPKNKWWKIWK